jgi:hypothetical protein
METNRVQLGEVNTEEEEDDERDIVILELLDDAADDDSTVLAEMRGFESPRSKVLCIG